jgi:hypothetical protein
MARTTFSGPVASNNGYIPTTRFTPDNLAGPTALTAAELATGYIAHEGAANITLTLPRAVSTAVGVVPAIQGIVQQLNAVAGQTFDFQIDAQTAGAGTVTVALGAAGALSALATAVGASAGLLVVAAGNTGTATFRLTFTGGNPAATYDGANIPNQPNQGAPNSATGYTLTRIS